MKKEFKTEGTRIEAVHADMLLNDIQNVFGDVIQLISEFNNETLNAVPYPGSWTAGQVAEHIIKSTGGIPDQNVQPVGRPYDEKDEAIKTMFLDMDQKFVADPFLQPGPPEHNKHDLIDSLIAIRALHVVTAEEKDLTVLCMDMEMPGFGVLTRYEWIRFILHHTTRHTIQLQNIRRAFM